MTAPPRRPGFVVLRQRPDGAWEELGVVRRRAGLPARAAREAAVLEATQGAAKRGAAFAAVLRSEWRVSRDWSTKRRRR